MKNHINKEEGLSSLSILNKFCKFLCSLQHNFVSEKKLKLVVCGECDKVDEHQIIAHTTPQGTQKDTVVKAILLGLVGILMIVVMMDVPYASYPGGSTPFLVMISTLICLSVIALLNL